MAAPMARMKPPKNKLKPKPSIKVAKIQTWRKWCEENSKPKTFFFVREKPPLTRWQKRGPMTRRDWVHFYRWAHKNATPRRYRPHCPIEVYIEPCIESKPLEQLLVRLTDLSKPRERKVTEKYIYPPEPVYTYSPKIHYKKPPNHDPGRPFRKPHVPKVFQHIDLETQFWKDYRFPIRRATLRFVPSEHMLELAEPRVIYPEDLHCPLPPPKVEIMSPRIRMTHRQWKDHLRRLEYLARPVMRPCYDDFYS